MARVILLTGPGGAGKTTVSELLTRHGYVRLDADRADTEFFPHGGQWLPERRDSLLKAHNKIVRLAKELYDQGKDVVVDYIIFGRYAEFIDALKTAFGRDLRIIVLWPSHEETVHRDLKRECWTTGEKRITEVRAEFDAQREVFGSENYIDTTTHTPEDTVAQILKN